MSEMVNSICFHPNRLSWIQAQKNQSSIVIQRALQSELPLPINIETILRSSAALQIANHLHSLASSHEIDLSEARFLLSGRFVLIKKIVTDASLPEAEARSIAQLELEATLSDSLEHYYLYFPDYSQISEQVRESMAVLIRRDILDFFKRIGKEANISLPIITISPFTIDEFFRKIYSAPVGQVLVCNFTEHGYEFTILDDQNFQNYWFRPYTKTIKSIEQVEEEEIFSTFDSILDEIKSPGMIDTPLYSISQIYVMGEYFKPQWLEVLRTQTSIPIQLWRIPENSELQIYSEEPAFRMEEAYRFVEPLSNIF